jgi:hypothetical protein
MLSKDLCSILNRDANLEIDKKKNGTEQTAKRVLLEMWHWCMAAALT